MALCSQEIECKCLIFFFCVLIDGCHATYDEVACSSFGNIFYTYSPDSCNWIKEYVLTFCKNNYNQIYVTDLYLKFEVFYIQVYLKLEKKIKFS